MATAGQEAAAVGQGQLLHRLPSMLAHSAHHSVRQDIHSPGQREECWILTAGACPSCDFRTRLLSPDDSIGGASAQQAISDWNHTVNGLSSQGKPVTCGPKSIPVEEVDGTFTGATGHLPPTLQGNRANHFVEPCQTKSPTHPYPIIPSYTFIIVTEVRSPD